MLDEPNREFRMPRNGEPRPAPLVEVAANPPGVEVPEVSLLLDHDKNKPSQFRPSTIVQLSSNGKSGTIDQRLQDNKVLHGNQFESYNTWKAKNALALHNITGSLTRTDISTKRAVSSKKSSGTRRRQNSNDECYNSSGGVAGTSPFTEGEVPNTVHPTQINNSVLECRHNENGNFTEKPVQSYDQQRMMYSNNSEALRGFTHSNQCLQPRDNRMYPSYSRENHQCSGDSQHQGHNCTFPMTTTLSPYSKDFNMLNVQPNIHMNEIMQPNNRNIPTHVITSSCGTVNQGQCHCGQDRSGVGSINGIGVVNREPLFLKETKNNPVQTVDPKVQTTVDITEIINNQLSNLYRIINLQNEQILMLLQEVKQIHQVVLQIPQERDRSPSKKFICCNCTCEHRNNEYSGNCDKNQSKIPATESNSVKKVVSLSGTDPNDTTRRSIGVMTSSVDDKADVLSNFPNGNACTPTENEPQKIQKQYQKQPLCNSTSNRQHKHLSQKDLKRVGERGKSKYELADARAKTNKGIVKASNRGDDSFSLNEAELVIRTEAEQDDASPNISLHVDMPDYSNSDCNSNESDTTESSSDEDDGAGDSETEGESADPQIGWTFYDRVVGQVNNILKKPSTVPHQERDQASRRPPAQHMYLGNVELETENNWSKRVTFDGPPLEDSDNNIMHAPRFNQSKPNHDFRNNGGPERMSDLMMYNLANGGNNLSFANGSTNVSFATLRYLERYHLLPSHPVLKVPDPIYHDTQKNKKSKKKKSKPRHSEKNLHVPQQSYRRKSNQASSKLLDITALKQQPKLF